MNKDIGVILLNLTDSPLCKTILNNLAKISKDLPYSQVLVFCSSSKASETFNIPILHVSHAKFFDGIIINTDVTGLILTNTFTNFTKRYFFAYETPWLGKSVAYSQWYNIFMQEDLGIISENVQIDNIYNMCWKQTSGIAEGFNHERILNIISKTKN